jgi:hypothetical protein
MMVGEYNYDDIFHDDAYTNKFDVGVTYIFFIAFLIVMSIIIVNLLVGLAVDDIKAVQEQAVLKRIAMQVELVLDVERLVPTFWLRKSATIDIDEFQPISTWNSEYKSLMQSWMNSDQRTSFANISKHVQQEKVQEDILVQLQRIQEMLAANEKPNRHYRRKNTMYF